MTTIYRCQLELHDSLYYATREIGRLYETEPILHNYALCYALGLVDSQKYATTVDEEHSYRYFCAEQIPKYEEHLIPLNEQKIYVTPARSLFHTSILKITSILGTSQSNQPWANSCPYQQLYDSASDRDRKFTFSLVTPTTFSKQKYQESLPTPESIFRSILKRWNKYSSVVIPEEELPLDSLFPSFFKIETAVIQDYSKSKLIGCIGDISYQYLGNTETQKIKYLNVLANYSLYCGLGKKTTMGMGMVRRINN